MVSTTPRARGSALIVTIVALAVVATMAAVAAGLVRSRVIGQRLVERDVRTVALADAAMAEMLARLAVDGEAEDLLERPFGHGMIRASVDRSDRTRPIVEAAGRAGGWEVIVSAELRWVGSRPSVVRWQRRVRAVDD